MKITPKAGKIFSETVALRLDDTAGLEATVKLPENARGLALLTHVDGDPDVGRAIELISQNLLKHDYGTVSLDLLTQLEDRFDQTVSLKDNTPLLEERLVEATISLEVLRELMPLGLAYIGIGAGAAPCLVAAARLANLVQAVVLLNGDLSSAMNSVPYLKSPTLLIANESDPHLPAVNEQAAKAMICRNGYRLINSPQAWLGSEEFLNEASNLAGQWLDKYLHGYKPEEYKLE